MTEPARTSSAKQFVTAFFDTRREADAAVDRMTNLGVAFGDIRLVAGNDHTGGSKAEGKDDKGFLATLADILMPNDDRHSYAEGLERGGFLLSVNTTPDNRDRIVDILDDEGTVDMDEREASWRADGWKGFRTDSSVTGHITGSRAGVATDEESPVVDKEQRIGKRQTDDKRARVRSYTVDLSD